MQAIRFIFIPCILFSSCYPGLYFADRVPVTAFTGKNQLVLNASLKPQTNSADTITEKGKGACYSFDAAYSFAENWAVTGYYSNVRDRKVPEDQNRLIGGNGLGGIHNGHRYELGITYFRPFDKHQVLEFTGSFSQGLIERTSMLTPVYNFKAQYNIYAGQMAYSYKWDCVVLSVGLRAWGQHYYDFDSGPNVRWRYNSENERNPKDVTRYPFVFTNFYYNFEYGYKFIKFNTQIGTPLQYTRPWVSGFPFYLTMGLVFRLEKDIFKNSKLKNRDEDL